MRNGIPLEDFIFLFLALAIVSYWYRFTILINTKCTRLLLRDTRRLKSLVYFVSANLQLGEHYNPLGLVHIANEINKKRKSTSQQNTEC